MNWQIKTPPYPVGNQVRLIESTNPPPIGMNGHRDQHVRPVFQSVIWQAILSLAISPLNRQEKRLHQRIKHAEVPTVFELMDQIPACRPEILPSDSRIKMRRMPQARSTTLPNLAHPNRTLRATGPLGSVFGR
jgi:hypothetical protein